MKVSMLPLRVLSTGATCCRGARGSRGGKGWTGKDMWPRVDCLAGDTVDCIVRAKPEADEVLIRLEGNVVELYYEYQELSWWTPIQKIRARRELMRAADVYWLRLLWDSGRC